MSRIRTIKPEFFLDEDLAALPIATRLLFVGLWTLADREGRMKDRPKRIQAQLFPYDDEVDADDMLDQLEQSGFLLRYEVDGERCIQIRTFTEHQRPHPKEPASELPEPPAAACREKKRQEPETPGNAGSDRVDLGREGNGSGKGKEGEAAAVAGPAPLALVPEVVRRDPKPQKPKPAANAHGGLLDAFGAAWGRQYGTAYTPTPADRSNLGRLIGQFPSAEAAIAELPGLFARYLADADRYYAERRHPLVLFVTQGLVNKYRARASPLEGLSDRERRGVAASLQWLEKHGEAPDARR